jgi:GR25 family glycosyltransferase involved in LPS biosynthesis
MATQAFRHKYGDGGSDSFTKAIQKPTPKISTYWIVAITLWAVTVFVIVLLVILWQTGVIFKCPTTATSITTTTNKESEQSNLNNINTQSKGDLSRHTLESTILRIPEYDIHQNAFRTEDVILPEKPVIEQLTKEVCTTTVLREEKDDYERKTVAGLERFIQHVFYIDEHHNNRQHIEKQIENLGLLSPIVTKERLSVIKRSDGNLGRFLSHIACLSKALTLKKNILILEDDFLFYRDASVIYKALQDIEVYCENRWDVICFGFVADEWQPLTTTQHGKLCRIYHTTALTGYLVNRLYIPRLLSFWIQKVRAILKQQQQQSLQNNISLAMDLQKSDIWVGLHIPFGFKKDSERLRYLDDLQYQVSPQVQKIHLHPPWVQKSIAICHVGGEAHQVAVLQQDCYLKFLKNHRLAFFWFCDSPESTNSTQMTVKYQESRTAEGAMLYSYPLLSDQESVQNIVQARDILMKEFDYVFYMDNNYRIYQHPIESQLLVSGLVATEQLHNLVSQDKDKKKKYALSFHGGETLSYLKMCQELKENMETNTMTTTTHDLSYYFQKYLEKNPPVSVLSQNYIFSEKCIDLECQEPMCQVLRESMLFPIMGPVTRK